MRRLVTSILLGLGACASPPERAALPPTLRPDVPIVLRLPAGARIGTALAPGLPDEPLFRAAAVWWREALRQSVRFDIDDEAGATPASTLVLAIDADGQRLSAFHRGQAGERALAGEAYRDGDLPGAIDRLAWAARIAVGEDAEPPVPVAACVSANPRAIMAAVDGFLLLDDGGIESGRRAFLAARRDDGGSPFVLDGLASVALMRGETREAERICREALGYEGRLSPTTQHRLARTLLLARASQDPGQASDRDRELLLLGQVFARERPHDPQAQLTTAIAHNFLAEFEQARPLLETLRRRLPRRAIVAYHLGWACLATGDAGAATSHFEAAALRLPMAWVAIPLAIAHFDAGDHEGLARLLRRLSDDADPRGGENVHELRRMQAAHALLRGDRDAAAASIMADLNWLLANPTLLDRRPGDFAEQGEVLVRIGHGDRLPPLLAAIQGQLPGTAIADTCAYLAGLVEITHTRERQVSLEDQLGRGGDSVFALRLQAFAHEQRGELADLHAALARAARMSDTALTKALLAQSLASMGRVPEAQALRQALRRELTAIHLRNRPVHPLLGPELAFAYLLE